MLHHYVDTGGCAVLAADGPYRAQLRTVVELDRDSRSLAADIVTLLCRADTAMAQRLLAEAQTLSPLGQLAPDPALPSPADREPTWPVVAGPDPYGGSADEVVLGLRHAPAAETLRTVADAGLTTAEEAAALARQLFVLPLGQRAALAEELRLVRTRRIHAATTVGSALWVGRHVAAALPPLIDWRGWDEVWPGRHSGPPVVGRCRECGSVLIAQPVLGGDVPAPTRGDEAILLRRAAAGDCACRLADEVVPGANRVASHLAKTAATLQRRPRCRALSTTLALRSAWSADASLVLVVGRHGRSVLVGPDPAEPERWQIACEDSAQPGDSDVGSRGPWAAA